MQRAGDWRRRLRGVLSLVLVLVAGPAFAAGPVAAAIDVGALADREGARAQVVAALQWWPDAPADATLAGALDDRAAFIAAPATPGFGMQPHALWFRLPVVNGSGAVQAALAEIGFSRLDDVDAWLVRADGRVESWHTGDAHPWSTRPQGNPRYAFPFVLASHEAATLYLRVASTTVVMLPLTVHLQQDYASVAGRAQGWHGVFYGMALGLLAYAFLFRAAREIAFAYYIGGCLLGLLYFLSVDGILAATFPDAPAFAQMLMPFGGTASVACILLFTRRFLGLPQRAPRLDRVLRAVALVALAGALLVPVLPPAWLVLQMIALSIAMAALMTAAGVTALRQGFTPARWFLVAIAVHLVVLVLVALGALAVVPGLFDYADAAHRAGFVLNLACFTLAIGDRIRLQEEEGRRAGERAQEVAAEMRARSEFLSRMSHELRTPMTGVLGMAELLDNTTLEPPQRRYLSALRYSAEMLLNLVNDVLDHARLQAGNLRLSSAAFDLLQVVDDCRRVFAQQPRDNGVALHIDVGSTGSRIVVGDMQRVRQVLIDLLASAFRFTSRGTVTLRVRALPQAGWLRFEVEATGVPGVGVERLFELFPSVPAVAGGSRSGSGIGLAISRELVASMGGRSGGAVEGGVTLLWCELPLHASLEPGP